MSKRAVVFAVFRFSIVLLSLLLAPTSVPPVVRCLLKLVLLLRWRARITPNIWIFFRIVIILVAFGSSYEYLRLRHVIVPRASRVLVSTFFSVAERLLEPSLMMLERNLSEPMKSSFVRIIEFHLLFWILSFENHSILCMATFIHVSLITLIWATSHQIICLPDWFLLRDKNLNTLLFCTCLSLYIFLRFL